MNVVVEIVSQRYVMDSGMSVRVVRCEDGQFYVAWGIAIGDDVHNYDYTVDGPYSTMEEAITVMEERA